MPLHEPECTCRACRREERELNKAMGTERTYIKGRTLNQDEKDEVQKERAAERLKAGRRMFDFYS